MQAPPPDADALRDVVGWKIVTTQFDGHPYLYVFENTYRTCEEADRRRRGMKEPANHTVCALVPMAALEAREREIVALSADRYNLHNEVEQLRGRIDDFRQERDALAAKVEELEATLTTERTMREKLHGDFEKLLRERDAERERADQAERDVRMYRDMDNTWKATANEVIDDLRSKLDAAEALLARCRDWIKFAANSDGGIVAEIERACAKAEKITPLPHDSASCPACAKAEKGES